MNLPEGKGVKITLFWTDDVWRAINANDIPWFDWNVGGGFAPLPCMVYLVNPITTPGLLQLCPRDSGLTLRGKWAKKCGNGTFSSACATNRAASDEMASVFFLKVLVKWLKNGDSSKNCWKNWKLLKIAQKCSKWANKSPLRGENGWKNRDIWLFWF